MDDVYSWLLLIFSAGVYAPYGWIKLFVWLFIYASIYRYFDKHTGNGAWTLLAKFLWIFVAGQAWLFLLTSAHGMGFFCLIVLLFGLVMIAIHKCAQALRKSPPEKSDEN